MGSPHSEAPGVSPPSDPRPPGAPAGALGGLSERTLAWVVYSLTAVVCGLVVVLITFRQVLVIEGLDVGPLPAFHAILNGSCAVLLVMGVAFIRRGRVRAHRATMVGAFTLSAVFLISYVIYHSQSPGAHFGGEGWVRPLYFTILISHIALAPVVLPLALYTVVRAFRGEFSRHRRIARWTFPVWLYVAVTGVMVYIFMAPYYAP
jgi:putative membrane protein